MTAATTFRIPVGDGEVYWTLPADLAKPFNASTEANQELMRGYLTDLAGVFFLHLCGLVVAEDTTGLRALRETLAALNEEARDRTRRQL